MVQAMYNRNKCAVIDGGGKTGWFDLKSGVRQGCVMFKIKGGSQWNCSSCFCSYLSGKTQRISVQGALSNVFHLRYGVPQGSCLGVRIIDGLYHVILVTACSKIGLGFQSCMIFV